MESPSLFLLVIVDNQVVNTFELIQLRIHDTSDILDPYYCFKLFPVL